jgi:hypothetical protein
VPGVGVWVIPLPFTKALSLNDRYGNQYARARAVREWRDATRWSVRAAKVPHYERILVGLHYIPKDMRRRDPNNLIGGMKPCEDALVDEGVVDDDTLQFMQREYPTIHDPDPKIVGGRFWLTIVQLL